MDCSLQAPLSTGILQARILEWVAIPSSRGSFQPRDQTRVFDVCCIKMMQGSNPSFWCALHQNVCQNVSVCPHWQAGSLPLASPGTLRDEANHTKVCRVCLFRILASILRVGLNMKYFCVPKWFKDHIEPNELLFIYIHILYVLWFSRDSANPIAPYWLYVSTGAAITECHRLDGLKQKLKKQKKNKKLIFSKFWRFKFNIRMPPGLPSCEDSSWLVDGCLLTAFLHDLCMCWGWGRGRSISSVSS